MNKSAKNLLNNARPDLSNVSPIVFKLTWAFVPLNILIGLAILLQKTIAQPPLITQTIPNEIWASFFIAIAGCLAYSLLRNDWKMQKRTMTFALFIKAVWGLALLVQVFRTDGEALGVLAIWLFIAYVQANCLIHFLPPTGVVTDATRN